MRTFWMCEECRQAGTVEHDEQAGIFQVLHLIEDRHHEISPICENGLFQLQTMNVPQVLKIAGVSAWAIDKLAALIEDRQLAPGERDGE